MRFLFLSFLLLLSSCNRASTSADAGALDSAVEAAKLVPFLPSSLGSFTAKAAATTSVGSGPRIDASRSYSDAAGREVVVRLLTGDLRGELPNLDSDAEHAFLSDTPTYWRTTSIAGHRTRIGEERPIVKSSTCVVRVGPNHIAYVDVQDRATAGECATLASLLDFNGIAATGGVPGPPSPRR